MNVVKAEVLVCVLGDVLGVRVLACSPRRDREHGGARSSTERRGEEVTAGCAGCAELDADMGCWTGECRSREESCPCKRTYERLI